MRTEKTKHVCVITVIDPDTGGEVEVEIRKTESGVMVGLDGSFLEQSDDQPFSPYDRNVRLIVPDDEAGQARRYSLTPQDD